MAVLKSNLPDGFSGKTGNEVVYLLNGKWVKRSIGIRKKTKSIPLLASQQRMKLMNSFLKAANTFFKTGFGLIASLKMKSPYCVAYSSNHKAVQGVYPNQFIDYSKLIWSEGTLENSPAVHVNIALNGLEFTWETSTWSSNSRSNDHVMLMAYLPEKELAIFETSGNKRALGMDTLILPVSKEQVIVETYICFIASDHSSISTSIYTGRFIWGLNY